MDRVKRASEVGLWDQAHWFSDARTWFAVLGLDEDGEWCGTSGCFAGHYAMVQGYTRVSRNGVRLINPTTGEFIDLDEIAKFAADGLGLDVDQAAALFHADNTLTNLQVLVDEFVRDAR